MKKILLIVTIVAGGYQLKAQAVIKPNDSTLFRTPNFFKNIKPGDTPLFKKYFSVPPPQNNKSLSALIPAGNTELFASRMPIAKVRSDDHMLIAKMHSDDRMPVQKMKVFDPLAKASAATP